MESVAALVLAYNEEENIEECLESIKWIDEIIVIDSYSKDKTVDLSRKYTNKVYQRKFDNFSSQRNFGLEQIESEWVLVIDADERVSPELRIEILETLKNPKAEGYRIPRKNYFLGKWIKYAGWYPDYTLRLFKVNSNRFNGLVHEDIQIKGKVGRLREAFLHYTYKELSQFIKKTDQYTTLDAQDMFRHNREFKLSDILIRPSWRFIKMYILKRGYRDGIYGFILSGLYFFYGFIKYAKLWEEKKNNSR